METFSFKSSNKSIVEDVPIRIENDPEQELGRLLSLSPNLENHSLNLYVVRIGRRIDCDIIISHPIISGLHAEIRFDRVTKQFSLTDLSMNGTWINEKPLQRNRAEFLFHGDEISFPTQSKRKENQFFFTFIFHDLVNSRRELIVSEMDPENVLNMYDFVKELGKGSFGVVWLTIKKATKKKNATKVIDKRKFVALGGNMASILDEVAVLNELRHPNICSIDEVLECSHYLVIVLELVEGGDLGKLIEEEGRFSDNSARHSFRQIFEALRYLHSKGIIHRDLKPENVLITKTNPRVLKLTDFGLAKPLDRFAVATTVCGTPLYVAPEIIEQSTNGGYTESVDLWSVGVMLYQILCGTLPFNFSDGSPPVFEQIRAIQYQKVDIYFPDFVSRDAADLVSKLLIRVDLRISAEQALEHPWFHQKLVFSQLEFDQLSRMATTAANF